MTRVGGSGHSARWTMPIPLWQLVKARLNSVIWYSAPDDTDRAPLIAPRNRIRTALHESTIGKRRIAIGFPADEARVIEDVLLDLKAGWAIGAMDLDGITVERSV